MGDFVAEDGSEGVGVAADVEDAAVHENFSSGEDKGIGGP